MSFLVLVTYQRKLWAVIRVEDEWRLRMPIENGDEFDAYGIQAVIEAFNKDDLPRDPGTDLIIRPTAP